MRGDETDPSYDAGSIEDQLEQIRYHRTLFNTAEELDELSAWESQLLTVGAQTRSSFTEVELGNAENWGPYDEPALRLLAAVRKIRDANEFVPRDMLDAINVWISNNQIDPTTFDLPPRTAAWWKGKGNKSRKDASWTSA